MEKENTTWKYDRSFRNRLPLAHVEIGFSSIFSIANVVWTRAHLPCLDSKTRLCGSCSSRWDSTTVTLLTWFPFYELRCDSPLVWVKQLPYFEILRCYYLRKEKVSIIIFVDIIYIVLKTKSKWNSLKVYDSISCMLLLLMLLFSAFSVLSVGRS